MVEQPELVVMTHTAAANQPDLGPDQGAGPAGQPPEAPSPLLAQPNGPPSGQAGQTPPVHEFVYRASNLGIISYWED